MNKKNKKLKKFYEQVYKKGEEKHYTSFVTTGTPSAESSEVLKIISWKNKHVLDVGCGTGLFSYMAAKKGANVIGIDYSKEAITVAQKSHSHPNLLYQNLNTYEALSPFDTTSQKLYQNRIACILNLFEELGASWIYSVLRGRNYTQDEHLRFRLWEIS